MPVRILCVCVGNVCGSPMAEGAIRRAAERVGVQVEVDSAGTGAHHVGEAPDARALRAAEKRGYDNSWLRVRQIQRADFMRFQWIIALDHESLAASQRLCPVRLSPRIELLHPEQIGIPDPLLGGHEGCEHALDLIEEGAQALVKRLANEAMLDAVR